MTTLMIAMGIYIVGVAIVLYTRPQLMFFAETGAWKEFGLDSGRTIMPFWMFALLWAIISYVAASLLTVYFSGLALQHVPADVIEANIASVVKPVSKSPPPNIPVSAVSAPSPAATASSTLPGYYVLETPKSGPPKYVYFGTEPPTAENLGRIAASN
jgi:hypothetical protein